MSTKRKPVEAWAGIWNRGGVSIHSTERDAHEHLDGRGVAVKLVEDTPELRALRALGRAAVKWADCSADADFDRTQLLVSALDRAVAKYIKTKGKR